VRREFSEDFLPKFWRNPLKRLSSEAEAQAGEREMVLVWRQNGKFLTYSGKKTAETG